MFVNDLIYTAAEWRPGPQGGQTFSQKNIKNPFQKIPESLGGIEKYILRYKSL
jgi:hypothetical protein